MIARMIFVAVFAFLGGRSVAQVTKINEVGSEEIPAARYVIPHIAMSGGNEFIRLSDGAVVAKDELERGVKYILRNGWETELVYENNSNFTASFKFVFWRSDGSRMINPLLDFGVFGTYSGFQVVGSITLGLREKMAGAFTITSPLDIDGWVKVEIYPNTAGAIIPPGGVLDTNVSVRYRYRNEGVVKSEALIRSWNAEDLPIKYPVYYDRLTSFERKQTSMGFAFTNPTDQWNEVKASFPSPLGSFNLSLPPRSKKIGMLEDFGIAFPPDSSGLMTVESTNGLQLGFVALHVNKNHEGFTISTVDGAVPKQ